MNAHERLVHIYIYIYIYTYICLELTRLNILAHVVTKWDIFEINLHEIHDRIGG